MQFYTPEERDGICDLLGRPKATERSASRDLGLERLGQVLGELGQHEPGCHRVAGQRLRHQRRIRGDREVVREPSAIEDRDRGRARQSLRQALTETLKGL